MLALLCQQPLVACHVDEKEPRLELRSLPMPGEPRRKKHRLKADG